MYCFVSIEAYNYVLPCFRRGRFCLLDYMTSFVAVNSKRLHRGFCRGFFSHAIQSTKSSHSFPRCGGVMSVSPDTCAYKGLSPRVFSRGKGSLFWFPSTQGRRNGWVGGRPPPTQKNKKSETQGNAAPERQTTKILQKSSVQKNTQFSPLKTNGQADGNQKRPSLTSWVRMVCVMSSTVRHVKSASVALQTLRFAVRVRSYRRRLGHIHRRSSLLVFTKSFCDSLRCVRSICSLQSREACTAGEW